VTNFAWQTRAALRGSVATAALSLAMLVGPSALAQDTAAAGATGDETIIVTGSRINNPNLVQSSPVSVIGADEVTFQQPLSAEDLIRDLPGAVPSTGPQTNNGSDGSARANLRGLGSNRNLVLLNSRRITPRSTDGVVDLNIIPVALIERVDVFTGGASTVYGADAVAGVLNFITKQDFAGIDMRAQFGLTGRGDGRTTRLDLTTGVNFDDGRGNAVLSIGYTNTQPVLQGDRAIGTIARQSTNCTAQQIAAQGCNPAVNNVVQGFPQGSPTAAPASIFSPFNGAVDPTGTKFTVGPNNDYNFQPINLFQTPLERYNIFGQTRYEITDNVEVYAEAMFTKTIVEANLAPSGVFGSTVQVPLNSQFLSAQQRDVLCNAAVGASGGLPVGTSCATAIAAGTPVTVSVGRRFVEAGPRVQKWTTNMFHLTGGVRGKLTDSLDWDISAGYGQSDRIEARTGWGLLSRVRSGVSGCPTGSAAGCVPINLFGPTGSITPQMLNFIEVPSFSFANTSFTTAMGTISGDLGFSSPFASNPVGIAAGVEYREYTASSAGDGLSRIPGEVLGAGAAALPIAGRYNTNEVYGEVIIPIVEDKRFFHSLTFEGGVRYADYSTTGGNWTWKAGGSWEPVPDVRIRGMYSRAVRAPNIAELFAPQVVSLTARPSDPCQGTVAEVQARGPNHRANCLAQLALVGAPAGLLGSIAAPAAGQIQSTQGGNPDLDPETATTYTIGAVVQPRFLPNVSLSFDYWNIRVVDAITLPSQSDVIDGCFDRNVASLCNSIFRNPLDGRLSGPAETTFGPILARSNLGRIETSGFDLSANGRFDFDWATLTLNFNATWTQEFLFQATPASINRQCVGYYSVSCGVPQPRFSSFARATLGFNRGTTASLAWRHLSGTRVEPVVASKDQPPIGTPTTNGPTDIVQAYQRIGAYDYIDLALQQQIGKNLNLTFTVSNLFDRDPPAVGQTIAESSANSGGTFPTVYDPLGRRYVIGLNLRF